MKKKKILSRYSIFIVVMFLIFSLIIWRLINVQILNTSQYKNLANKKSVVEIAENAPRGNIIDTNGNILANNKQSYILTYTNTDESEKNFFHTMDETFQLLDENGETFTDDFSLKYDSSSKKFSFDFKTDDANIEKQRQIQFLKDRGIYDTYAQKLFKKSTKDLTDDQLEKVNQKVLKIKPDDVFNMLLKNYFYDKQKKGAFKGVDIKKYSIEEQRKFIAILDQIALNLYSGYKPVTIASSIQTKTYYIFEQKLSELPGINVTMQPIRSYPNGDLASSVLGYISKINPDQQKKYKSKGYDVYSDVIGQAGLEYAFENELKGTKGGKIVKLNSQGRVLQELGSQEPVSGDNLQLTLNKDVQYAAEQALQNTMKVLQQGGNGDVDTTDATRGAAVVEDVNTGGIIAMAQFPKYDPNIFTAANALTSDTVKSYFSPDLETFGKQYVLKHGLQNRADYRGMSVDDIVNYLFPIESVASDGTKVRRDNYDLYPKPFYNYATMPLTPVGSTFKPVTALAGLQEGVITPSTTVYDAGVFNKYVPGFKGSCWIWSGSHGSHGSINVSQALTVSCNYFFFEVGERLWEKDSFDCLAKYGWMLGLGGKSSDSWQTGIEIPENFGQIYNFESSIKNKTRDNIQTINSVVKNQYQIDIIPNDSDSQPVIETKNKIKSSLSTAIKTICERKSKMTNSEESQFINNMLSQLKELTSKSAVYKNKTFTNSQYMGAVRSMFTYVNNAYDNVVNRTNVYDAAIGQGENTFTPLQLANYVSTLVNGGNRYKVHLLSKTLDSNGKVVKEYKPEVLQKSNFSQTAIDAIKEGMKGVTDENGTSSGVFVQFNNYLQTGGKTGSATFAASAANPDLQGDYGRTSYAVYIGFAPYDKPQIAVSVIIFDGGHGGFAAPVARAVYEAYFKDSLKAKGYSLPSDDSFLQYLYK